jgi:hypothetical protein
VTLACRDRHGGPTSAEVHSSQVVAHLVGIVSAGQPVLGTKLSIRVVSPALDRRVIKQRASVVVSHAYILDSTPGPKLHNGQIVPHLTGTISAVRNVSKPKLSKPVGAPALEILVRQHCTRVRVPSIQQDSSGCVVIPEIHAGQILSHRRGRHATRPGITEPKLAKMVLSPALDHAIHEKSTRVSTAARHRLHALPRKIHRRKIASKLRCIASTL